MKQHRALPISILAVVISITAFSAFAQPRRLDFNRAQTYDVQHYTIRAKFDRGRKAVIGDTTVALKPLKNGFHSLELDAEDMAFTSVKLDPDGAALQFRTSEGKVIVTLDRDYRADETVAVRFQYTATPKKGVYFVDASSRSDAVQRSAQIWTQGEPDEARHWFPSFDFPSDKATTETLLTVENGEVVIGNGELRERRPNPDGTTTWHHQMTVPHSTYLVSFVIGRYNKVEDKYKDIPLGFYVYPGREATARKAFGETAKMMEYFEQVTGVPYPYNKYDQTIVANFQFGGMENITATTMADTEIFFADFEFGKGPVMDLVSHELAHSWFGNLVTCRNWAELWLNEGFATFMEAAYREKAFGRGDYMKKIRSDAGAFLVDDTINRRRHGLYNQRAGDVSSLFDNAATTYNKGGAVVHMLREQVGDAAFWKGINLYLTRHKFAPVETTDLIEAMEEASGQELDWFFQQWVYGAGAPNMTVRPVYSAKSKTLTLRISQTQLADTITPSAFRLPLEITVKAGGSTITEKADVNKRIDSVTIKVPARPTEIEIDPNERIVVKKLKMSPIAVAR